MPKPAAPGILPAVTEGETSFASLLAGAEAQPEAMAHGMGPEDGILGDTVVKNGEPAEMLDISSAPVDPSGKQGVLDLLDGETLVQGQAAQAAGPTPSPEGELRPDVVSQKENGTWIEANTPGAVDPEAPAKPLAAPRPNALSVQAISSLSFLSDPVKLQDLARAPQVKAVECLAVIPAKGQTPATEPAAFRDTAASEAGAHLDTFPAGVSAALPTLAAPTLEKSLPEENLAQTMRLQGLGLPAFELAGPSPAVLASADVPQAAKNLTSAAAPLAIPESPSVTEGSFENASTGPNLVAKVSAWFGAPEAEVKPLDAMSPTTPKMNSTEGTGQPAIRSVFSTPPGQAEGVKITGVERMESLQPASVAGRMAGAALMASPELVPLSRSAGGPVTSRLPGSVKFEIEPSKLPVSGMRAERIALPGAAQVPSPALVTAPVSGDKDSQASFLASGQTASAPDLESLAMSAEKSTPSEASALKASAVQLTEPAGPGASAAGPDALPVFSRESVAPNTQAPSLPPANLPPPATPLPQAVAAQVARHLQSSASTGTTTRISLSDESLGDLVIEMKTDDAGQLRIVLRAENTALLSTIRADRETLLQSLNQAGVSVDDSGLGFEDLGQRGKDGGDTPGRRPEQNPRMALHLDTDPLAPARASPTRLTAEPGRLDILT